MSSAGLPSVDDLVAVVEGRAGGQAPAARLQAAIELGRDLSDMGDALIGRFVTEARDAGLSWTEVGQLFGTSKQAVQQRFGAGAAQPDPWPGRWTADARTALNHAAEEAQALGHGYVGTEHVLLALASSPRGLAAEVLADLDVTRDHILGTSCMETRPETGSGDPCRRLMPRLKQALEQSRRIADDLRAERADTEHLLAGILAVSDSMAVEILRRLKVRPDAARRALAERLDIDPDRLGRPRRRRRRLLAGSR